MKVNTKGLIIENNNTTAILSFSQKIKEETVEDTQLLLTKAKIGNHTYTIDDFTEASSSLLPLEKTTTRRGGTIETIATITISSNNTGGGCAAAASDLAAAAQAAAIVVNGNNENPVDLDLKSKNKGE